MYIVLNPVGFNPEEWNVLFNTLAPDERFEIMPRISEPKKVEVLLTMAPPDWPASLFPKLRCAIQLGHGVDGLLRSGAVPSDVPVVRLVDNTIITQLTCHALAAVLRYHCKIDQYDELKQKHNWQRLGTRHPAETQVGVLGLGHLGINIVDKLRALGFSVCGWSRSAKALDGVETFTGPEGLTSVLRMSDVVVCLLPLAKETVHILDRQAFAAMKPGAFVINLGRGGVLNQDDLISALSAGQVGGAYLDVFEPEPLPFEHPLWTHPKVTITPHAASETRPASCIHQIIENVSRLKDGRALVNVVDRNRGY